MDEIKGNQLHTWIDEKGRVLEYAPSIQKLLNANHLLMSSGIISHKEYYIIKHRIQNKVHKNDPM